MKRNNKLIAFAITALFVVTGTYNAVVINSESLISGQDVKFVKRLDEIYGVTVPGREVAASVAWKKIETSKIIIQKDQQIVQPVKSVVSALAVPGEAPQVAAVQEELTLNLVEVINPNKWKDGLPAAQFNGSLSTNNGVIEELLVSLPNGEGVSVSFSEMTGNVFEYDFNGELYSGMMYQVDQSAYMVTLTNGPLEGTRLRFSSVAPAEQQVETQETLAQNNVDVGAFGSEAVNPEALLQNDKEMQQEAIQAQGFNFEDSKTM